MDASEQVSLRGNIEMLRNDRLRLEAELKQQGMSLEHEQATREALERQLNAQSEELKKVRKDLSFYRENAVRSGQ